MKVRSAKSIEKKIDNIIKTFPEETKKDENLKKFIQLFFGKIINDDLLSQSSQILFNISNSIYDFLKTIKIKKLKFVFLIPKIMILVTKTLLLKL